MYKEKKPYLKKKLCLVHHNLATKIKEKFHDSKNKWHVPEGEQWHNEELKSHQKQWQLEDTRMTGQRTGSKNPVNQRPHPLTLPFKTVSKCFLINKYWKNFLPERLSH